MLRIICTRNWHTTRSPALLPPTLSWSGFAPTQSSHGPNETPVNYESFWTSLSPSQQASTTAIPKTQLDGSDFKLQLPTVSHVSQQNEGIGQGLRTLQDRPEPGLQAAQVRPMGLASPGNQLGWRSIHRYLHSFRPQAWGFRLSEGQRGRNRDRSPRHGSHSLRLHRRHSRGGNTRGGTEALRRHPRFNGCSGFSLRTTEMPTPHHAAHLDRSYFLFHHNDHVHRQGSDRRGYHYVPSIYGHGHSSP